MALTVPSSVPEAADTEKMRWSARTCSTRMLHVLVEERAAFLQRDAPLAKRSDLDGAARNSFWQRAALVFVDPSFKPEKFKSDDEQSNEIFDEVRLTPEHFGYPATAEKMETEFKKMRSELMVLLNKCATAQFPRLMCLVSDCLLALPRAVGSGSPGWVTVLM
ncbi:MAG: hypothetical protein ACO32I_09640, partial [Candidatus Limnocylindrus sp.]